METNPERVTKAFLTAVRQGDHGQLAALLHPEVNWLQPGSNRFSGEKRSNAEVFQMAGGLAETANHTLQLTETKAMAVNGNRVACLIHWQATMPTGKVPDVDNIDV
jgi:ketosteroid isomerase-like protein